LPLSVTLGANEPYLAADPVEAGERQIQNFTEAETGGDVGGDERPITDVFVGRTVEAS
jgi:hypothetical protein